MNLETGEMEKLTDDQAFDTWVADGERSYPVRAHGRQQRRHLGHRAARSRRRRLRSVPTAVSTDCSQLPTAVLVCVPAGHIGCAPAQVHVGILDGVRCVAIVDLEMDRGRDAAVEELVTVAVSGG